MCTYARRPLLTTAFSASIGGQVFCERMGSKHCNGHFQFSRALYSSHIHTHASCAHRLRHDNLISPAKCGRQCHRFVVLTAALFGFPPTTDTHTVSERETRRPATTNTSQPGGRIPVRVINQRSAQPHRRIPLPPPTNHQLQRKYGVRCIVHQVSGVSVQSAVCGEWILKSNRFSTHGDCISMALRPSMHMH